jgi:hypothetical protein
MSTAENKWTLGNFVRAPLYVNPIGPGPSTPPGGPVQ